MATAGPHTAFFYGTLMAPTVMWRVCHGTAKPHQYQKEQTSMRPALLTGYERRKVKYRDYPAITPCQGACVRGSLVTGLTDMDLLHLDTFEGGQYSRQKVQVKVLKESAHGENIDGTNGEEETAEAETYVWSCEDELEAEEWDFEEFQKEKMQYWDGELVWEDDGFDDVDRQVAEEAAKDPTGGRAVNGVIGKELETMRAAV